MQFPSPVDYDVPAEKQNDGDLELLLNNKNLKMVKIQLPETNKKIYCETSTDKIKPYTLYLTQAHDRQ